MVINTNTSALSSARLLQGSQDMLAKSLARLSSVSKIVSPSDDAAALAVSSRLDAQINRNNAAQSNVGNAVSFSQTQDGYMQQVGKAFNRMSELSVLSQDVTKSNADRALYDAEFQKLGAFVTDVATKQFNGVALFSATAQNVTSDSEGTTTALAGADLGAAAYTTATGSAVDTAAHAVTALTNVKAAITQLSADRATVGANISVLNSYNDQLGVLSDNLSAANSRIKDVNVATESTQYARFNILVQSGTSMLAQANQQPQSVLKLLQ